MEKTIRNMINQQNDNLIFLTSEKNEKLSYGEFKIFNEKISRQLAATNVKNNDRAAIVLPNGPLMASSFLSISSYMSAAPLNPSYKQEEFEFYLDDLKPKFLLVEPNSKSLAVIAAKNLNISVFEMKISDNQPLGTFELFDKETDYKNPNDYDEALEFMSDKLKILGGSENEFGVPTIISSWANHYNSWKKFKKNYLLIKYENLLYNPKEEFLKITKYYQCILIDFDNSLILFRSHGDRIIFFLQIFQSKHCDDYKLK